MRLFQNNTLNEILVFDLSLATGLYALTIYAGTVMGTRRRGIKDRLCIRIGITESSNMLHYSNASSIEKSRRYLVIKGGACLVALARERGRQLRSRTGQQQRRSRSLPERRGGRNNEYQVNRCISIIIKFQNC